MVILQLCASSLHSVLLRSQAVKEIQNLCETSKYLEEQRMRLMQIQSVYVKELSLLTGAYNLLPTSCILYLVSLSVDVCTIQICRRENVRSSFSLIVVNHD